MLELIVYPKPKDKRLINNSPFCAKTEIFLNLAKIDYKIINFNANPGKFKNAKLPVINLEGRYICDSSHIEIHLTKTHDIMLNSHLSRSDMAIGYAFSRLVEDNLYWSILHERWFIESNWNKLKAHYFSHMPAPIRWLVPSLIQRNVLKAARGHGMALHSNEEIHNFGFEAVKAISDFLAEKNFILGEKVTSFDATIYAFISSIIHSPYGPKLSKTAHSFPNIIKYDERMFKVVYE
jgi:glutathione S-transferase